MKFYLAPEARSKGIGRELLNRCLDSAIKNGYQQIYIESFPELDKAVGLYLKAGFRFIEKPMGNSGHYACTIWMIKDLI